MRHFSFWFFIHLCFVREKSFGGRLSQSFVPSWIEKVAPIIAQWKSQCLEKSSPVQVSVHDFHHFFCRFGSADWMHKILFLNLFDRKIWIVCHRRRCVALNIGIWPWHESRSTQLFFRIIHTSRGRTNQIVLINAANVDNVPQTGGARKCDPNRNTAFDLLPFPPPMSDEFRYKLGKCRNSSKKKFILSLLCRTVARLGVGAGYFIYFIINKIR